MKGRVITSDEREFKMHQCIYYLSPKKTKRPERSFIFDKKIKNPQKWVKKLFSGKIQPIFFRSSFLVKKLLVVFLMWLMNWIISFEILLFRKIYIFAFLIQSDFFSFWSSEFFFHSAWNGSWEIVVRIFFCGRFERNQLFLLPSRLCDIWASGILATWH